MTDDISTKGPFSRTLVYVALAAFIAMVVVVAAPLLGSSAARTVGFTATIEVAQGEVNAFGSARLADDGRLGFTGSRLSFSGTIEGDQVKIEGKVALADESTRSFRASGRIAGDRANLPVHSRDGRRIGSLRLRLPSE